MSQPPADTPHAAVAPELWIRALPDIPTVNPGDALGEVVGKALHEAGVALRDHDVLVVASKIVARAENCFVDLSRIEPSNEALKLGAEVDKDPRLVELILRESRGVSRKKEGVLIVRHRLGFISANAGIDASNAAPPEAAPNSGPWVLTLPRHPDETAANLRGYVQERYGVNVGVVISDSWGRPFRRGTLGFAIGVAGLPAVLDRRGARDRHGRELEATDVAIADAVAAAADLVAGQANESRPVLIVRGLRFQGGSPSAASLLRDPSDDLYA